MLKKCHTISLLLVFIAQLMMSAGMAEAAPKKETPILKQADITIMSEKNGFYKVKEDIQIIKADLIKNGQVEHTLSKINNGKPSNLTITVGGKKVQYNLVEGKALSRLSFTMPEKAKELIYTIKYDLQLPAGIHTSALAVPAYPSSGKENNVTIDFTAPKGNFIHENSFPILPNPPTDNHVTSHLANIPSHVNYAYDLRPSSMFNSYNMISCAVFIVLVAIVAKWIMTEMRKQAA